jgi:hypothetical protein
MVGLFRTTLVVLAVIALSLQASVAYAHSSEVFDPAGDLATAGPAYSDIVHAMVTEQVGKDTLYFKIEVAERIPDTPTKADGTPQFVAWNWNIDGPVGGAFDYGVVVRYCSHTIQGPCIGDAWHWESELITPTGRHVNAFPFTVDGATVKASVDLTQLGAASLSRLDWFTLSRTAPGVSGVPAIDFAPNSGVVSLFR